MAKIKVDPSIKSECTFTGCGKYRYRLMREQPDGEGTVLGIFLNPSIADTDFNDPTIARFQERAFVRGIKGHVYKRYIVCNAFAYISTDRSVLGKVDQPIGPENDHWIMQSARESDLVIVGYGNDARLFKRCGQLINMLLAAGIDLHCFDVTKLGFPGHPLYLPYSLDAKPYRPAT